MRCTGDNLSQTVAYVDIAIYKKNSSKSYGRLEIGNLRNQLLECDILIIVHCHSYSKVIA